MMLSERTFGVASGASDGAKGLYCPTYCQCSKGCLERVASSEKNVPVEKKVLKRWPKHPFIYIARHNRVGN